MREVADFLVSVFVVYREQFRSFAIIFGALLILAILVSLYEEVQSVDGKH